MICLVGFFKDQKVKGSYLLLSAPIKTGKELGMKESYDEGQANHIGPESCVDNGNIISEALTGESAGWVLSPVRDSNPSADALQLSRIRLFTKVHGLHSLISVEWGTLNIQITQVSE